MEVRVSIHIVGGVVLACTLACARAGTEIPTYAPLTPKPMVSVRTGEKYQLWEMGHDGATGELAIYIVDVERCQLTTGKVRLYRGGDVDVLSVPAEGMRVELDVPLGIVPFFAEKEDFFSSVPYRPPTPDAVSEPRMWVMLLLDDSGLRSQKSRRQSRMETTWRCFGHGLKPTLQIDTRSAVPTAL